MTKDPYNFDFLALREGYDEKELKDALMADANYCRDRERIKR